MFIWNCTDVFLGGGGKRGYVGELSLEEFIMGETIFMKGAQDFLALFLKKNEKINIKKFFQLKVRKSIKT